MTLVAAVTHASSHALQAAPAPGLGVAELFDLHAAGLYRLALAMLHDADAAQDVVQDTFLKLLDHLGAGRPLPSPKGWLFTVAAHACRDRQRRSRRWLPWSADTDRRQSGNVPGMGDARGVVLAALQRLRPRDRLLVALRAHGLTYGEIADSAHIREASVGRLLARALERLAREIAAVETQR